MNKKAIADSNKQLYWTFFIIPAYVLFAAMAVYSVSEIVDTKTSMSPILEDYRIQELILGTNECFATTEHGITGYVDLKKFNEETLRTCLENMNYRPFLMTLTYENETIELRTPRYEITRTTILYTRPIILIENQQEKNALLEISVSH